jgi:hypothetical protein
MRTYASRCSVHLRLMSSTPFLSRCRVLFSDLRFKTPVHAELTKFALFLKVGRNDARLGAILTYVAIVVDVRNRGCG